MSQKSITGSTRDTFFGDDLRYILFIYTTKVKGVPYSRLGLSKAYGNMIKNKKRRVSDPVLEKILETLTAKEFIDIALTLMAEPMQSLKTGGAKRFRARRLAWLGRRPDTAEVRGSSPRGPTNDTATSLVSNNCWLITQNYIRVDK